MICPECGCVLDDKPRSVASHHSFFAELQELYDTMPEIVTERFPSFDAFRKFCLIRTGWRNETVYTCETAQEALRWSIRLRQLDSFSVVAVSGLHITVWTAKSQSMKSMGKEDFQKSRDDVTAYAKQLLERKTT